VALDSLDVLPLLPCRDRPDTPVIWPSSRQHRSLDHRTRRYVAAFVTFQTRPRLRLRSERFVLMHKTLRPLPLCDRAHAHHIATLQRIAGAVVAADAGVFGSRKRPGDAV
jgi:hypothetical protein